MEGGWRGLGAARVAAIMLAVACVSVTGCGDSADDGTVRTDDPAAAFAPVVRIDRDGAAGAGALERRAAYVERGAERVGGEPGLRLTYRLPPLGADRDGSPAGWARVSVLVRGEDGEYEPVSVELEGGRGERELRWAAVGHVAGRPTAGGTATHPVVTVAASGELGVRPRRCGGCASWRTWSDLRDARDQPWYGFSQPWGEPVETARPELAFAPLIGFHSRETAFPIDAERFIQRSSLKWRDGRCILLDDVATGRIADRKTSARVPRLRAELLGTPGAYERRVLDAGCDRPRGPVYTTTDYTRPYDRGAGRVPLKLDQGFYMDMLSASLDGDPRFRQDGGERVLAGTPAYYDSRAVTVGGRRGVQISYWQLYGATEEPAARGEETVGREGGWERVDVVAVAAGPVGRRWIPVAVVFHQAGERVTLPWRELELVAGDGDGSSAAIHPVVLAARGSHVPYSRATVRRRSFAVEGERFVVVDRAEACARCPRWRTWELLRPLRSQPWRGFGGGWGLAFNNSRQSGPLGPSPYAGADTS